MTVSTRLTLKSLIAASATTAIFGIAAVPAAYAGPKTTTTTTTDTSTITITTTVSKDTKTGGTGRKIG